MTPWTFTELRPQVGMGSQELMALSGVQASKSIGPSLASAARTADTAIIAPTYNYANRGLMALLNITVASGTGGLRVDLYARFPTLGTNVAMHSAAANKITTGNAIYIFYPELPLAAIAGATYTFPTILPVYYTLYVIVGDASSYTYSVETQLLP
jgi:hypothetical protein